jgi:hypothetical protein
MRVSSYGQGNDARFDNKRLRLSSFNSLYVTVTGNRYGLRNRNLNRFDPKRNRLHNPLTERQGTILIDDGLDHGE